jgi:hypothetical protein
MVSRRLPLPRKAITKFSCKRRRGIRTSAMLTKQNAAKFLALFPTINAVVADRVRGREWYDDPTKLTYLATYTNEKAAQKELEAAAQRGWMPQNTAGTAGHINVGRTAAKVALLGPISLVTGASRSKDKITITYVRTPRTGLQHIDHISSAKTSQPLTFCNWLRMSDEKAQPSLERYPGWAVIFATALYKTYTRLSAEIWRIFPWQDFC